MSRRERGTYSTLDNRVIRYAKTHWDASSSVLVTLAERANFREPVLKVAEIMLETDLGQRAIEKCLVKLEAEGLAYRCANGWAYRRANDGANSEANQDANEPANRGANQHANDRANNGSLKPDEKPVQDSKEPPLKEVEGSRRKKEKNPPNPPGGSEGGLTGDPTRVQKATQKRPAPPDLPDDLAALPGLPEAWQRWLKYGHEKGLKITDTVADAQFKKLRALHSQGWELTRIVQHAIENNWRSFFKIRGEQPGHSMATSATSLDAPTPSMADLMANAPLNGGRKAS